MQESPKNWRIIGRTSSRISIATVIYWLAKETQLGLFELKFCYDWQICRIFPETGLKTFLATGNKPIKTWKFAKLTRWTIAQRNQAIGILIRGNSNPQVAKFFRVQMYTITRLWYRWYEKTGSVLKSKKILISLARKFLASLAQSVILSYENLPDPLILYVVESMPRRIQHCIRKRGGYTEYRSTQKYSFKTCFYLALSIYFP